MRTARRMDSFDHSSPEAIAAIYLDIAEAVKPGLAIVDASIGLEGDGPALMFGGKTVDMKDRLGAWTLLASTDPVAADATAARITGQKATDIKQLVMAHDRGLGQLDEARATWSRRAQSRLSPAGAATSAVSTMRLKPVRAGTRSACLSVVASTAVAVASGRAALVVMRGVIAILGFGRGTA